MKSQNNNMMPGRLNVITTEAIDHPDVVMVESHTPSIVNKMKSQIKSL